jgi:hypothetical protein
LLAAGLEEVAIDHVAARVNHVLRRTQNAENAAHRHVHVDVAGAVQGVKHDQVVAAWVLLGNLVGRVHLFRGHACQVARPLGALHEHIVRQHVELFLRLALHVDGTALIGRVVAHDTGQLAISHGLGDALAGQRHIQNQGIEVTTGTGKATALFNQELRQRRPVGS